MSKEAPAPVRPMRAVSWSVSAARPGADDGEAVHVWFRFLREGGRGWSSRLISIKHIVFFLSFHRKKKETKLENTTNGQQRKKKRTQEVKKSVRLAVTTIIFHGHSPQTKVTLVTGTVDSHD